MEEAKQESKRSEELSDSLVDGAKRRERGPAEKARNKNNSSRDGRTNLGVGKPSNIVVD
jgi:hypothetical protein